MEENFFDEFEDFGVVISHLKEGVRGLEIYQSEIKLACDGLSRIEKRYRENDLSFSKPLRKQAKKVIEKLAHIKQRLEQTAKGCELLVREIEKSLATPLMQWVDFLG